MKQTWEIPPQRDTSLEVEWIRQTLYYGRETIWRKVNRPWHLIL
jgi:hypothetical protein